MAVSAALSLEAACSITRS